MAWASSPGSKTFSPFLMACSMFSEPTTRSSVALTGSSTTRLVKGTVLKCPSFFWQSLHRFPLSGLQWKGQPSTTSTCSMRSVSPRTAVDFAVPFSPRIKTPPSAGLMRFKISASFICSCPTMAVKG